MDLGPAGIAAPPRIRMYLLIAISSKYIRSFLHRHHFLYVPARRICRPVIQIALLRSGRHSTRP
jgi:hypothetical protein